MNGFKLTSVRAVEPSDMIPPAYMGGKTYKNTLKIGIGADAPPLLNDSIHRPHTMKVLGCKQNHESHRVLRRPALSNTGGMFPSTGYARGQKKGLAFIDQQPITGKIMESASSFYAGSNSKIPNLKG
jgi:hypothetical protein